MHDLFSKPFLFNKTKVNPEKKAKVKVTNRFFKSTSDAARFPNEKRHYRTVWISDLHLGTASCQADALLDFLRTVDCDYLYLVGDIVDGWRLKKSWYWPQKHNDVVQKILRMARKGCRIYFIPGNHDEFLLPHANSNFGGIEIVENIVHETADGRRLLVLHGHEFDAIIRHSRWLALIGDHAYSLALKLNRVYNLYRRLVGKGYWSLSAYLKLKVKNAVNFISSFEQSLVQLARKSDVNGVVCGHIHHAQISQYDEITYYNDGDWVESCTALVEDYSGELHLLDWFHCESLPDDKYSENESETEHAICETS